MVKDKKKTHLKQNKVSSSTISAIIVVGGKFDEELFKKAKDSLKWCTSLILIDGSKGSFSDWRNEGLKKTSSDWILYIDVDEEVTPILRDEILNIINSDTSFNAYAIPRKNIIFNKAFKYSGQYPDYQKRLFKTKCLIKWTGMVHEQPEYIGELGYLVNPILHHKNMTISEMIDKTNKWSEIEADLMFKANHPPMNFVRFFTAGFREFFQRFVKEVAFMDGKEGIIYGIYQIYSRLISYSKLWEKQQSTTRI